MLCGDIDLGQHLARLWLAAIKQQVITWPNIHFSLVMFCGIQLSDFTAASAQTATILYNEFGN